MDWSIKVLPLSSTRAVLNLSVAMDTSRKNFTNLPEALFNISCHLQIAILTYISLTPTQTSPSSSLIEKEVQGLPATNNFIM